MARSMAPELIEGLVADARSVWPENFEEIEERFNACCFAMAYRAVSTLGLFDQKGAFETMASIREKVGLFKDAEYVMAHILRILVDEKVLETKDDGWVLVDNEPYVDPPAEALVMATRRFPEEGAPFQWLARSQDGLVAFIKGQLFAEEIMLPDFKLVEEVYNTSNVYGFYSRLSGKAVKRLVEEHFDRPITLFEIGAGTGNGTANVLSETSDRFEKYIFTDVGKALMQMGKRRFKKSGYDFLDYRVYDACGDLAEQDIPEGCADMVLAVNVMHATDDIIHGLVNARRILRDDGILVLSEIAPPKGGIYRYMELTFGLLPSYSVYEDKALRPVAPIIRPDEWVQAFQRVGFRQVEAIPGDRAREMDRGGIVLGIK
jgi:SAM-dependent methyltransferase